MKRHSPLICSILFGLVTLFGVLSGIFSETYTSTANDGIVGWLSLPYYHLGDEVTDVLDLGQVERNVSATPLNFIFITDCSLSTEKYIDAVPSWVDNAISVLDREGYSFTETKEGIQTGSRKAGYIINMALFSLMRSALNTYEEPVSVGSDNSFSVWSVCDKAKKKFPKRGILSALRRENLDVAIEEVDGWRKSPAETSWTELLELFEKVVGVHKLDERRSLGDDTPAEYIITMISDFEDDPEETTPDREVRLKQAMDRIIASRVQFNLIDLDPVKAHSKIISYFETKADWYQFTSLDLTADIPAQAQSLLVPVYTARPLRFFYDSYSYGVSRASLQIEEAGAVELTLPFGLVPRRSLGRLIYGYRLQPREHDEEPTPMMGKIWIGSGRAHLKTRKNDIIDLKYEGPVPARQHMLRVFVYADRKSYLVPLVFIPRLPKYVSRAILCVYGMMLLGFVVVVCVFWKWGSTQKPFDIQRFLKRRAE